MPFLKRHEREAHKAAQLEKTSSPPHPATEQKVTFIAVYLGLVASIGGFMFGEHTGNVYLIV